MKRAETLIIVGGWLVASAICAPFIADDMHPDFQGVGWWVMLAVGSLSAGFLSWFCFLLVMMCLTVVEIRMSGR